MYAYTRTQVHTYAHNREEGPQALYKGVIPTVLRQATNQAANFTAFREIKKAWTKYSNAHTHTYSLTHHAHASAHTPTQTPTQHREEGPQALYKGVIPTVLRQATNQAANFTAFREIKKAWTKYSNAHTHTYSLTHHAHASAHTPTQTPTQHREEGPQALYKGVIPTVLRQATNQAANFTAYQEIKKAWTKYSNVSELQPWQHLLIGGVSGAFGPLCNSPIDVIKTRLQKQKVCGWVCVRGRAVEWVCARMCSVRVCGWMWLWLCSRAQSIQHLMFSYSSLSNTVRPWSAAQVRWRDWVHHDYAQGEERPRALCKGSRITVHTYSIPHPLPHAYTLLSHSPFSRAQSTEPPIINPNTHIVPG